MVASNQEAHIKLAIESFSLVWGVTPQSILSRCRIARVAECRMSLYKYIHDTTGMSNSELSRVFGKANGAVYHGLESIQSDLANNPRCRALYDAAVGLVMGQQPAPLAHAGLLQKVADLEQRVAQLEKLLTNQQLPE